VRHNGDHRTTCCPALRHDRLRANFQFNAKASGKSYEELRKARAEANPAGRFAAIEESAMPAPIVQRAGGLHYRARNLLLDGGAYRDVLT